MKNFHIAFTLVVASGAGCYTGTAVDVNRPVEPITENDGTEPAGAGEGEATDGGTAAEGVPCDVAALLKESCTSCHGERLRGGAPNKLVSYEDLTAKSEAEPDKTMAELSLARMKSAARPMPPDGLLPTAQRRALESWIEAGLPRSACNDAPDGGAPAAKDAAPADGAADASASVCTSGTFASATAPPSALMRPGKTCIACHVATGAPVFAAAGTVYSTMNEPDNCNGSTSADLKVLLIDALGAVHTMPVNAAGNFYRVTPFPAPYKAIVVKGNKTREMRTLQTNGDCNSCHSKDGTGAPGRVTVP